MKQELCRVVFAALALTTLIIRVNCQGNAATVPAQGQRVVITDWREIGSHELSHHEPIRISNPNPDDEMEGVGLKLIVGEDGHVISAQAVSGSSQFYTEAVSVAMQWKYEPFMRRGKPVVAEIRDYIRIAPPLRKLAKHGPFPRIKDWSSLRITLMRTGCFGACPSYNVELRGDGSVLYRGGSYVAITGNHRGKISQPSLLQLMDKFQSADYFSLENEYVASITDNPTYTTSIAFDGVSKSVVDYVGIHEGMPAAVEDLEDSIDRLVGVEKWLFGNGETASSLLDEGWNFKANNKINESLLAEIAEKGNADAVRALVAAGAPLEGHNQRARTALMIAASRGDLDMTRILVEAGAGANDRNERNEALSAAAYSGKLPIVDLLLSYETDPDSADEEGITPLMNAATSGIPDVVARLLKYHPDLKAQDAKGRTVLMFTERQYGRDDDEVKPDRGSVARLLIDAGADVNARDNRKNTPLMEAPTDKDVVSVLIANGADVNARNAKGWTPLTHASSPETVRLLLAAGADPTARDDGGRTELENAKQYGQSYKIELIQAALTGKIESTGTKK